MLDIYKELLKDSKTQIESAQINLADSIANGFVNFGSLKESLFSQPDQVWISKLKDKGIMTSVASLGFIYYQNFEEFSTILAEYFDLKDGYAKAGACIALGLSSTGIRDDNDPCFALLFDQLQSEDNTMKLGATIGLGLAYANTQKEDLLEQLCLMITDETLPLELSVNSALALGLIFQSSGNEEIINSIITAMLGF